MTNDKLGKIVSWAKRRGFVFQSSEIYGGIGGVYDFGPLGVLLKNNIKNAWWKNMVEQRDEIVGLDAAILMHPKALEASGHLESFVERLVECKKCHARFREDEISKSKIKCPNCQSQNLTQPREFNLLMKTNLGPVEDKTAIAYLRPETCQGIYLNFKNVLATSRKKIPFGIAQIGKAFRNEITPGNFIFRTREFEQMEMQFFIQPDEALKWFEFWANERLKWYIDLGIKKQNIRFKKHTQRELPHYAKDGGDIEYKTPFGWKEIEGIHNRGDWDLSQHSKFSGKDLSYENYIPFIIETSGGADRSMLAFILDAFEEVKGGRTKTTEPTKEEEVVLHLHPDLAPVKVAVLPLVKKLSKQTQEVYQMVKKDFVAHQYDEEGSIGRRYRRMDEVGTPIAITIDFQTLKDQTVTLRDRDTMKQERVKISELNSYLSKKFS